jgi:hypothetical protein
MMVDPEWHYEKIITPAIQSWASPARNSTGHDAAQRMSRETSMTPPKLLDFLNSTSSLTACQTAHLVPTCVVWVAQYTLVLLNRSPDHLASRLTANPVDLNSIPLATDRPRRKFF